MRSEFVAVDGQDAQVEALKDWVQRNSLQPPPCVCLVANDDCDVYQVERPEVENSEMIQALSWKIKDLINYDVSHAVVDSYPMLESNRKNETQVGVVTTIELDDPEKMFQLMNQLIYQDSKLKLLSLNRREVKAALPPLDPEQLDEEPGIYRQVLELRLAGKYLDILRYMQSTEALDWKLLWYEIKIVSDEYPRIVVKVVMSTLSTRKEWVGV